MGDRWKVLNTSVSDRTYMFALQASADDNGNTSTLSRSKPYSWDDKSTRFRAMYYSVGKRIMKQITTVHVRSSFLHVSCWRWLWRHTELEIASLFKWKRCETKQVASTSTSNSDLYSSCPLVPFSYIHNDLTLPEALLLPKLLLYFAFSLSSHNHSCFFYSLRILFLREHR
jgi:hypothetical protein